jgi:hypothetical protein
VDQGCGDFVDCPVAAPGDDQRVALLDRLLRESMRVAAARRRTNVDFQPASAEQILGDADRGADLRVGPASPRERIDDD